MSSRTLAPDSDGSLDVSDSKLSTLSVGGTSPDTKIVRLVAARNRLTTLDGVASVSATLESLDVTENSIRALDARSAAGLVHCVKLRTLICASNNISFADLTSITVPPTLRSTAWSSITAIDLSSNLLTEVPCVKCCVNLATLHLDSNQISTLPPSLEGCLPRSIESLSLANNAITEWYDLWSFFDATDRMHNLSLEGNACVALAAEEGFDITIFACAIITTLSTFNGISITEEQHLRSTHTLEQLDSPLPREKTLEALRRLCPYRPADAVTTDLHGLVSLTDFNSLAEKVQRLSKFVNVLRTVDKQKRVLAAVKIQSLCRMFSVRNALMKKYNRRLPRWNDRCPMLAPKVAIWHTRFTLTRVVNRVEAIEAAVRQVWVDQAHFRGYLHSKRVFAAVAIQKHWRGVLARRKYKAIRLEFIRFAENFKPAIIKIQSFARMVIAKRSVRPMHRQFKRQRELEAQLTVLRGEVHDLRAMVLQLMGQAQAGLLGADSRSRANLLLNPEVKPSNTTTKTLAAAVESNYARVSEQQHTTAAQRTAASTGRTVALSQVRAESPAVPSSASPSPLDGTSPEAKEPKLSAPKPVVPASRRVPPPVPLDDVPAHLKPAAAPTTATAHAQPSADDVLGRWRQYGVNRASMESTISPTGSTNTSATTASFRPVTQLHQQQQQHMQHKGVEPASAPTLLHHADEDEDEVRYEDDEFDHGDNDDESFTGHGAGSRDIDFGVVDDTRFAGHYKSVPASAQ